MRGPTCGGRRETLTWEKAPGEHARRGKHNAVYLGRFLLCFGVLVFRIGCWDYATVVHLSAIISPMGMADVAAGEGALQT